MGPVGQRQGRDGEHRRHGRARRPGKNRGRDEAHHDQVGEDLGEQAQGDHEVIDAGAQGPVALADPVLHRASAPRTDAAHDEGPGEERQVVGGVGQRPGEAVEAAQRRRVHQGTGEAPRGDLAQSQGPHPRRCALVPASAEPLRRGAARRDGEASEAGEPGHSALDHPAVAAEPVRTDAALGPASAAVAGLVDVELAGSASRGPPAAAHAGHDVEGGGEHLAVVAARASCLVPRSAAACRASRRRWRLRSPAARGPWGSGRSRSRATGDPFCADLCAADRRPAPVERVRRGPPLEEHLAQIGPARPPRTSPRPPPARPAGATEALARQRRPWDAGPRRETPARAARSRRAAAALPPPAARRSREVSWPLCASGAGRVAASWRRDRRMGG